MKFLLDTNVVSEIRKGDRADTNVMAWFDCTAGQSMYLSVVVLGELRKGIEGIRKRDVRAAGALDRWMAALRASHQGRIVPVDEPIAELWGRLNVPDPLPAVDGLLAATAIVRGMTLVTRNTRHVKRTPAALLNPFD